MAKKSSSPKKGAIKKSTSKKGAKKKAAPKKAAAAGRTWSVVCSKQGILERNLSQAEARAKAKQHQDTTRHPTTYTNDN